jgi:hypothetical protein
MGADAGWPAVTIASTAAAVLNIIAALSLLTTCLAVFRCFWVCFRLGRWRDGRNSWLVSSHNCKQCFCFGWPAHNTPGCVFGCVRYRLQERWTQQLTTGQNHNGGAPLANNLPGCFFIWFV